ncbi:hypothetical protein PsorP6_012070 [Peronosclerospora sorghi]|uniref:Uncharacterized protein n=1 Tax=Peronosclerospora sorghi TaxID=230839 RepID=A0ACC0WI45_9STRA|nr:hypothetical protein PsorP6_012070 [Peronosclerospora sorghi]
MDDEYPFAAMHPTAGYLFAEELDINFLALDDFHSTLLQDVTVDNSFPCHSAALLTDCGSPSSVMYLPQCGGYDEYPPLVKDEQLRGGNENVANKLDTGPYVSETKYLQPFPLDAIQNDMISDDEDKERLRRRQRGYEKRYRGRKRRDLKMQRDLWLALEMKLDDTRKQLCRPYVRVELGNRETLRHKLLLLKLEERALRYDQIAMRSLQSWEEISRIREYSDKDQLRTASEWRHSADKVIGRCAVLEPRKFHPYAPIEQRHFTW